MKKVGILGATGYAGQQLVAILVNHPKVEIEFLASHSYGDQEFSSVYENYLEIMDKKCISSTEVEDHLDKIDLLFTALPHGMATGIGKKAFEKGVKVVDLGSDFRLEDPLDYTEWYGELEDEKFQTTATYGLVEVNREKIKEAMVIGNPGCYPTATLLGLMPALKNNLIDPKSIIVDAKSGVSGAGRGKSVATLLCECSESIKAYKVANHRHTPEIEQEASKFGGEDVLLTFTPHLVPMHRGILSVIYGTLKKDVTREEVLDLYKKEYQSEKFVRVKDNYPETRWVKGSNYCDISIEVDPRTNRLIIMSVIDNLMKGAAGQGVQNMNVMLGFSEDCGLNLVPVFP